MSGRERLCRPWKASGKNIVFLGPSGSGKSEIALNLAIRAAGEGKRPVHFFDMDQTKPLFRSRWARDAVERSGAVFHSGFEFLDSPVLPDGVAECLRNETIRCILDMGGSTAGARSLGQCVSGEDRNTRALYVVNVYRPFSDEENFLGDFHYGCCAPSISLYRQQSQPGRKYVHCRRKGGARPFAGGP